MGMKLFLFLSILVVSVSVFASPIANDTLTAIAAIEMGLLSVLSPMLLVTRMIGQILYQAHSVNSTTN